MLLRRIVGFFALILFAFSVALLLGWITIDSPLPLDTIATTIAFIAGGLLLSVGVLEAQAVLRSWRVPEPEDPPRSDRVIYPIPLDDEDERVEKALHSMEQAEDFVEQTKRRVTIEVEEIPED